MMTRTVTGLLVLLAAVSRWAPYDPDYRIEEGAGVGMMA